MQKIANAEELKNAIQQLEDQQFNERILLKEHFCLMCESLKPVNIIKDSVKDIITSTELKEDIAKITLGAVTGFLTKKALVGNSHNLFSKLSGAVVEMIVAQKIIKNADDIKSFGSSLFSKFLHRPANTNENLK